MNCDRLELISPSNEYKEQVMEYRKIFLENDESFDGCAGLEECKTLHGCETGEAKITNAYKLPCKKVIHTVGPVYRDGLHNEEELLRNCYINSIKLAEEYRKENNLDEITIAFPCISTGVYAYPKEEAARVVINTLNNLSYPNINVIIACFSGNDYRIYKSINM